MNTHSTLNAEGRQACRSDEVITVIESFLVGALLICLTLVLVQLRIQEPFVYRLGDTLIFEQVLQSVSSHHGAVSSLFASTQKLIDAGAFSMNAKDYATVVASLDPDVARDMLKFHAYFIFYVISALAQIFGVLYTLCYLQVVSFTALLGLVYFSLRKRKVTVAGAVAFTLLVASHPAWGASIGWQFYPDRLFIGLGYAVFVAIHNRWKLWAVIPLVGLTLTINERAFTIIGLFLLAHGILYFHRTHIRHDLLKVLSGVLLVFLGSFIQSHVLENLYYSSFMPHSAAEILTRLANPSFRNGLLSFVLINCGLLGLSLFSWRAALIAIGLMLPNALGSIAGAEKTGFLAHYHSYYFPALVWSAGLGFSRVCEGLSALAGWRSFRRVWLSTASVVVCCAAGLFSLVDWAHPGRLALSWDLFASTNALADLPDRWKSAVGPEGAGIRAARDQAIAIAGSAAPLSAQQAAIWATPPGAEVALYPFGLEKAGGIVVVCHAKPEGGWDWNAVETFMPPSERLQIEQTFRDHARDLGFDVDHPLCSPPPFQIGIIKRDRNSSGPVR